MTQPNPDAGKQASEQAQAYKSIFAPTPIDLDDGTIDIPPHPNLRLLEDDRLAAYEELLFETESYDRGPEIYIPEQKAKDRTGNEITLPAETQPGPLLVPYRKNGELIKPPHAVRVVQAALGEEEYARLRAGGKSSADVWRIWNGQGLDLGRRADADPKSDGSSEVLEDPPAGDSQRPVEVPSPSDS